jgi:class 3 adenylate cyclase
MQVLRDDKEMFKLLTLQKRIDLCRILTIIWLLLVAIVSIIDYFLEVLRTDLRRYRNAILFRALGNNIIGMTYLLLLTSPDLFKKYAERLTVAMLICQLVAVCYCGATIYNNEPALIAIYAAYVLFYNVCQLWKRLCISCLAVCGYMISEFTCERFASAFNNIVFLAVFIAFMSLGVKLGEHLEHVSHFEERRVQERIEHVNAAREDNLTILNSLLPKHVVSLVGQGVSPIAEQHENTTIIFTDLKGFTAFSTTISPQELVSLLNAMYTAFDEIIGSWGLHKVEIIGDAYWVSGGCPANGEIPAHEYAMRAIEVSRALLRALPRVCGDAPLQMRVGVHSGNVVAGVVGQKGPRYHLFGPHVGYAEQMEQSGEPGRIHCSDATFKLLHSGGHGYEFEEVIRHVDDEEEPRRTWLLVGGSSKAAFQISQNLVKQRRISRGGEPSHTMRTVTLNS